jgi:hypothetical protein
LVGTRVIVILLSVDCEYVVGAFTSRISAVNEVRMSLSVAVSLKIEELPRENTSCIFKLEVEIRTSFFPTHGINIVLTFISLATETNFSQQGYLLHCHVAVRTVMLWLVQLQFAQLFR